MNIVWAQIAEMTLMVNQLESSLVEDVGRVLALAELANTEMFQTLSKTHVLL